MADMKIQFIFKAKKPRKCKKGAHIILKIFFPRTREKFNVI